MLRVLFALVVVARGGVVARRAHGTGARRLTRDLDAANASWR